jgi:hypothetical protein
MTFHSGFRAPQQSTYATPKRSFISSATGGASSRRGSFANIARRRNPCAPGLGEIWGAGRTRHGGSERRRNLSRGNVRLSSKQALNLILECSPIDRVHTAPSAFECVVPEIAWAYFSAFTPVLIFNLVRLKVLKVDIENPQRILKAETVRSILKAALPHQAQFIDGQDAGAYYYLLDEIEGKLLSELRKILDGKDADQAATQRAKEIMSAIKELDADQAKGKLSADLPTNSPTGSRRKRGESRRRPVSRRSFIGRDASRPSGGAARSPSWSSVSFPGSTACTSSR